MENETKNTQAEEKLSKEDKKFAKLEAKYDKAYDRKDALNEQIETLKQEILNEPDQKKKNKIRKKRDALIKERDSIIITEKEVKIPMAPKNKKIITAVVSIVVIIALLFAYVATGAVRYGLCSQFGWPQSTLTAYTITDGDGVEHKVKVSTYNYYFATTYNSIRSMADQYSQYGIDLEQVNMNVDFDEKLSKQERTEDGKTQTWLEYIQGEVEETIEHTYMHYYEAVKANDGKEPEITDDQKKEIKDAINSYKDSAHNYGFTISGYLQAAMGKGVTKQVFQRELKVAYIAENYEKEYKEEISNKEYDAKELEQYKKDNYDNLVSVDVKLFECDNEDDAKAFKKALKEDGSNFAKLASKYSSDKFDKEMNLNEGESTYTNMTRETFRNMSYAIATADEDNKDSYSGLDWIYSDKRKAGDVKQESTTVVYIVKPVYLSNQKTVNVRHILIAPESEKDDEDSSTSAKECTEKEWATAEKEAKKVLKEYKSGKKTAEAFGEIAKDHSSDGNASSGGLYENVVPNQMVQSFNDWCFDSSRKAGDVDIVKTEYGYHIMYFEGYGNKVWEYTAQQALAADETEDSASKLEKSYSIKKNWLGSRYFEIDTDIDS